MRTMPVLVGCVTALLLVGAASADSPEVYFSFAKANTGYGEFWRDQIACATASRKIYRYGSYFHGDPYGNQSSTCAQLDSSVFLSCMSAKGYRRDANGFSTYFRWRVKDSNRACDDTSILHMMTKMSPQRVYSGPRGEPAN